MKIESILICGQAGQGIQTIGYLLSKILIKHGYYIFAWQDFQSRIRGGESSFRLVFKDVPVYSLPSKFDLILSLDENNTKFYSPLLKDSGLIISDSENFENGIKISFEEIAQKNFWRKNLFQFCCCWSGLWYSWVRYYNFRRNF